METGNSFCGPNRTTIFPVRRQFNKWEQVLNYNIPKFKPVITADKNTSRTNSAYLSYMLILF